MAIVSYCRIALMEKLSIVIRIEMVVLLLRRMVIIWEVTTIIVIMIITGVIGVIARGGYSRRSGMKRGLILLMSIFLRMILQRRSRRDNGCMSRSSLRRKRMSGRHCLQTRTRDIDIAVKVGIRHVA